MNTKSNLEVSKDIESDLIKINAAVDQEFNKLVKYDHPEKNQPIVDAIEFVEFTKTVFIDTISQNEELLSDINNLDKDASAILSNN